MVAFFTVRHYQSHKREVSDAALALVQAPESAVVYGLFFLCDFHGGQRSFAFDFRADSFDDLKDFAPFKLWECFILHEITELVARDEEAAGVGIGLIVNISGAMRGSNTLNFSSQ